MNILLINGSPKGKRSNTYILATSFIDVYTFQIQKLKLKVLIAILSAASVLAPIQTLVLKNVPDVIFYLIVFGTAIFFWRGIWRLLRHSFVSTLTLRIESQGFILKSVHGEVQCNYDDLRNVIFMQSHLFGDKFFVFRFSMNTQRRKKIVTVPNSHDCMKTHPLAILFERIEQKTDLKKSMHSSETFWELE